MIRFFINTFLSLLFTLSVSSQETEMVKFHPKVKFSDYKVDIYTGHKANLLLNSPENRRFRTALRNGYKSGINYAGHYCLVYWGCGSPCQSGAIIDVITGQVYYMPSASVGYKFKKNSRMLIINPPDSNSYYYKDALYGKPEIYILDDSTKEFEEIKY